MIAIDTNVLVRVITADDPVQTPVAANLFRQHTIYLTVTVMLETAWVLQHGYRLSRERIVTVFRILFGLSNIRLEAAAPMHHAILWYAQGLDFADALHVALSSAATEVVTFDQQFARQSADLTSVPVRHLT
ncbi:MAG: type II toxin-antitoxin system VapC family toxin [Anaerolineales bacterium]|nr:type II toxin-antitoxin system VapC family toxin [Anaerolineales bacterium]